MIQRLVNRQRLPRIGKIRLGVTVTKEVPDRENGGMKTVSFPSETPYFVVPAELAELYGKRPTRLPILFPSDEIDKVLPTRYEIYAGGLLTLDCDGENAVSIPKKGPEVRFACERPMGEPGKPTPECKCGAKAKGQLNVIVLGGGIGTYQITVGGEQRLADLLTQLHIYRETFGSLKAVNGHPIPFEIVRVPQTSQIRKGGEDGERLTREGYPVKIVCHFTAEQALEARGMRVLEAASASVKQLTQNLPSSGETDQPVRMLQNPPSEPPQASLLDDHPDDIVGPEPGDADALAGLRADLETLFSDAAGGNRVQAANLVKLTVKKNLGIVVTGLGDLDEAGLRKIMSIMSAR